MNQQQLQITPDMIKNASGVSCDECGNITFKEVLTFKKISAILSPTGKEEVVPMPVIVCDVCEKVSKIFDPHNVVPNELKAVPSENAKHVVSEMLAGDVTPKMEVVKD